MQKSASLLGLGENAVCCVDANDNGTIKVDALQLEVESLKSQGLIPFCNVVGTAGTTDHGAIDDLLDSIAELAQANMNFGSMLIVLTAVHLILSSHKTTS